MRFPIFGKKQAIRTVFGATGVKTEKPTTPDTNYKQFIDDDAVLNSNLKQLNDAIFEFFPRVDKKDKKTSDKKVKERNEQLEKVQFGRKVKDNFNSLWHNGNMFFEIVVIGNKLKEFYWVDADTMKVEEDDYGNVIKYIQSQPGGDKEIPKDRILHIKAPSLRTGTLGKPLLMPLKYPLNRKQVAENYLAGMVENLHPLLFLTLTEANDEQAKQLQNAIRAKRDPLDPLKLVALLPDESVGRVDTGTTDNFDSVSSYIDRQNDEIIRVVQIPPIVAGTVDNSNRSNSEIQERAVFGRTVVAWQNFLVHEFNRQFKDKLGWGDTSFEFPEADERKQEAALVRAQKLKEIGYSNEAIHDVLVESGVKIKPDFQEMDATEGGSPDLSQYDSRKPRDKAGIPQNEEKRKQDVKNGTKKEVQ